jgi:hypothetical protein
LNEVLEAVWEQEVVGSNPATPTLKARQILSGFFVLQLFVLTNFTPPLNPC